MLQYKILEGTIEGHSRNYSLLGNYTVSTDDKYLVWVVRSYPILKVGGCEKLKPPPCAAG